MQNLQKDVVLRFKAFRSGLIITIHLFRTMVRKRCLRLL